MAQVENFAPSLNKALGGESTGAGDNSTTFSKSNVLGMFLTLVLCLLTQPFGNLLYSYSNNWFSKLIFLTWRLNPLICLIEAIGICIILCSNVAASWKESNCQPIGTRGWRRNLQVTAAALLLLRAKTLNRDGGLMLEHLYYELANSEETKKPAGPTSQPHAATASQYQSTGLSRRTVNLAETGVIKDLQPVDTQTTILKQALGSNALSHSEFTIDVFTFATILFMVIKLGFITMAWQIKFAAVGMISGWLAVQTLLLLLHTGELSELDMGATVKMAWSLRYLIGMRNIKDLPRVNNFTVAIPILLLTSGHLNYLLVARADGPAAWVSILMAVGWVLIAILWLYTRSRFFAAVPLFVILAAYFDPSGYAVLVFGLSWTYILFATFMFLVTCYPMMIPPNKASWLEVLCAAFNLYFVLLGSAFMFIFYQETGTSKPSWLDIFG